MPLFGLAVSNNGGKHACPVYILFLHLCFLSRAHVFIVRFAALEQLRSAHCMHKPQVFKYSALGKKRLKNRRENGRRALQKFLPPLVVELPRHHPLCWPWLLADGGRRGLPRPGLGGGGRGQARGLGIHVRERGGRGEGHQQVHRIRWRKAIPISASFLGKKNRLLYM